MKAASPTRSAWSRSSRLDVGTGVLEPAPMAAATPTRPAWSRSSRQDVDTGVLGGNASDSSDSDSPSYSRRRRRARRKERPTEVALRMRNGVGAGEQRGQREQGGAQRAPVTLRRDEAEGGSGSVVRGSGSSGGAVGLDNVKQEACGADGAVGLDLGKQEACGANAVRSVSLPALPSACPAPVEVRRQRRGGQTELMPVHGFQHRTRLAIGAVERFERGWGDGERPRGDDEAPRGVVAIDSEAGAATGWDPSYDMWDSQQQLWPYKPAPVVAAARKFLAEHGALVEGAEASLMAMRRAPNNRRAERDFQAQLITMQRQRFAVQPLRRRAGVTRPRGPLLHEGLAGLKPANLEGGPWSMPSRSLGEAGEKVVEVVVLWTLDISIWAPRCREWGSFYNEGVVAEKAFGRDWFASMAAHSLVKTILKVHPEEPEAKRVLKLDKEEQLRMGAKAARVVEVEKELWAQHKLLYACFNYYAGLGGHDYGMSFNE